MQIQLMQTASIRSRISLDPRTKLFLLLAINLMMMAGSKTPMADCLRLVPATIPFLLLAASGRGGTAAVYMLLYGAAQIMQITLYALVTGVPGILLRVFAELMLRFVPGTLFGYYLLSTTRVSEFIAGMERLRVTRLITIPLSVMFRFFPTVWEESRSIGDAMRMRGIGAKSLFRNPAAMLEYRMVPLMLSIAKIANELSAAALTRGLGSPNKRTNICKIGFGLWDMVLAGFMLAALCLSTLI